MPKYTINGVTYNSERELSDAELEELGGGAAQPAQQPPSLLQQAGSAFVEQLPAIGATVVPVATTLATGGVGLPVALGTAGVGAAAGETLKQMIQGRQSPDIARVGQEAAIGVAGEGFGQALGPLVKSGANLVKSVLGVPQQTARQAATLAEREAAQSLLQRRGATLSAGQVGGSWSQILEGASRAGLGEGAFATNQKAIGQALEAEKQGILELVSSKNIDDVASGQLLKQTLADAGDTFSAKIAPFYERVLGQKAKGVNVDTKPIADTANKVIKEAKAVSETGTTPLGLDPDDYSELLKLGDTAASMSFAQAHNLRSSLLRQARILETKYGTGTPLAKTINDAVATLNTQMDDAAKNLNPQLLKEYRAVSAEYKRAMSTLYDDTLVKLLQKNPEKVGDAIGQAGNVTEALKVKQALRFAKEQGAKNTDEIFDNFLSGYLQNSLKGTGDEISGFVQFGDRLAKDRKFQRTFNAVLADKPVVKENINSLISAAKIAERENKPTILSGVFGTGAQGALVTGVGAAALGTPAQVIAQIGLSQAALGKILTNKGATNLLLRAEKLVNQGKQTEAIKLLQESQLFQRAIGQGIVRTEPIQRGLLGIQPQRQAPAVAQEQLGLFGGIPQ
jgi:hypothetical protein